ncbi:MAG: DNA methyltransferase [Candidatus Halichondribacter symbioticus]
MKNTLYTKDNLYILNGMNSETVDLIYLDPPFNSKRTWSAPIGSKAAGASFKDMWTWQDVDEEYLNGLHKYPYLVEYILSIGGIHGKSMMSYITYMTQRIIQMHRVLKDTGSLYLHVDPVASHYLKIVLDEIFGKDNFQNELIWYYKNASRGKKRHAKSHDIILYYSKSKKFTFNADEVLVPFESGMTAWSRIRDGREMPKGKVPDDVLTIPAINGMAKERTGYPTQKPLALLHHIIQASSNKDEVVFDPFCGCATTCVAAQQLQRQWIGIDIEAQAVDLLVARLSGKSDTGDKDIFSNFIHTDKIPQRTDIKLEKPTIPIKHRLFKVQKGICNGCAKQFDIDNFDVDHIIPKSKGGGDYYENFQLLCGHCNRVKGNRPMEDLIAKLRARAKAVKKISY